MSASPGHPQPGAPTRAAGRASLSRVRAGCVLLLIAAAVIIAGLIGLDRYVYNLTLEYTNTPNPLDVDFWVRSRGFWEVVRLFGSVVGGAAAFFIVAVIHPRGWPLAVRNAIPVGIADLTTLLLQFAFGRVRPNRSDDPLDFRSIAGLWDRQLSYAVGCFPSGEATAAFALAVVLAGIYPRWAALFYAIATLNALARVVQGAHYLSDVAAGTAVGVLVASLAYLSLERRADAIDHWLLHRVGHAA